jgi:hypothetical protein
MRMSIPTDLMTLFSRILERVYENRRGSWFETKWFQGMLFTTTLLMVVVSLASRVDPQYVLGQIVLILGVYFALFILSSRPLLNPVQAVVFIFLWWFGLAPSVTGAFYLLIGSPAEAIAAQVNGMESLWIVALGLPLYAIVANQTLIWLESKQICASFLMPQGVVYKPRTVLIYWLTGGLAALIVLATADFGIQGITVVNYLGATRTDIWWVGVIQALTTLSNIATAAVMFTLAMPKQYSPRWFKVFGIILILQTLVAALTSGIKGAFVYIFLYFLCARFSIKQVPPWRIALLLVAGFLLIVEPFVFNSRLRAEASGARDQADRITVFLQAINEGDLTVHTDLQSINISSLFRGIYPLAGELTRRNSLLNGYWQGITLDQGLQALIPRALSPDKPNMDIGNFMARTVGVDIGVVTPDNFITSVAVSIPFEFVGNYGWLVGVGSFALIGFVWALLCGWLLSPQRLAMHPLSPWLVFLAFGMEAPLASFLATFRDLAIVFGVAVLIWLLLKKRL